jgi:hypothetical protein
MSKLAAAVHRTMSRWLFRVPTHDIGAMPLLGVTDIPYAVAISPRVWFDNVTRLRQLQKNFTVHSWPSLSALYPRSVMWTYVYALFFWARYCDALPVLLANPDKTLPAEIFLRYICEIDAHIDSFDSRVVLKTDPQRLRRSSSVREVAHALCLHLNRPDVPDSVRQSFLRLILGFRHDATDAMRCWDESSLYDLARVIAYKERTAGSLLRTWGRGLSYLYEIPEEIAEDAAEVFFNLSMAIQVLDDLGDIPIDYPIHTQNLCLAVIRQSPHDWEVLQSFLATQCDQFIHWPWVHKNIPQSDRDIMNLYQSYAQRILDDKRHPELTRELHDHCMEGIRRLLS